MLSILLGSHRFCVTFCQEADKGMAAEKNRMLKKEKAQSKCPSHPQSAPKAASTNTHSSGVTLQFHFVTIPPSKNKQKTLPHNVLSRTMNQEINKIHKMH